MTNEAPIRVLVVDDHPMMREALCTAIDDEADLRVAGQARNGAEAVDLAERLRPGVILMDLMMPVQDGVQAIRRIMAGPAAAPILALTSSTDEAAVLAAVEAGALGYLLKDAERPELLRAIHTVAQGEPYLPPAVALKLFHSVRRPPAASAAADPLAAASGLAALTPREREVLRLLGEGVSNETLAQALSISESTARTHVHRLLQKLELENRSQAALFAQRHHTRL